MTWPMADLPDHDDRGPAWAHQVGQARQGGLCAACWLALAGRAEAHHRQRRRESVAGWCPCNVVLLHPRCHTQGTAAAPAVHDRPTWAKSLGLIVPAWDDPRTRLLTVRWPWRDDALLTCDGMVASPAA